MQLNENEKNFMKILPFAIKGNAFPAEINTSEYDWQKIFLIADQHKLLPIIFESVYLNHLAKENKRLFYYIKQQTIKQVQKQVIKKSEFDELYDKLIFEGLKPIVLKGQLCAKLYKMPYHRNCIDDDLYIIYDDVLKYHRILSENGLSTKTDEKELSNTEEISYRKAGSELYLEIHRTLFDYEDSKLNALFEHIQKNVFKDGNYYSLSYHDGLLYLIVHAYKHFFHSGVGIRQLCDIGLWAKEYGDEIDWELLFCQLSSVNLKKFATAIFNIIIKNIGIEVVIPVFCLENLTDTEDLLQDILSGGVYGSSTGSRAHTASITVNAVRSNRKDEKTGIVTSVFPSLDSMKNKYVYLKKAPLLLPLAWLQRLIKYAKETSTEKNNNAGESLKIAKERIELLHKYGIID